MLTHLMIDTETLGTRPGAVILSAAVVRFSDEVHTTINLNINEQLALGSYEDDATHDWWYQQPNEAWRMATNNAVSVVPALQHLSDWIKWAAAGGDSLIWCHGAGFDAPLLEDLYRRAGLACPWAWRNVRDTRTLYDLAGVNVKDYAVPPPHVALNDAIGQVRAANAALAVIRDRRAA